MRSAVPVSVEVVAIVLFTVHVVIAVWLPPPLGFLVVVLGGAVAMAVPVAYRAGRRQQ